MLTLTIPSAMKEIGGSLPLTPLMDTNGNSLYFVPCTTDLDTDSEDLKVTGGYMGKKEEEYNLEDNFDLLCLIDRDGDGQELGDLGPGVKRTLSKQSQNAADEMDEQSAKRRHQVPRGEPRPPPANSRQTRTRPDSTVQYAQPAVSQVNTSQPSPVSTAAQFCQGAAYLVHLQETSTVKDLYQCQVQICRRRWRMMGHRSTQKKPAK